MILALGLSPYFSVDFERQLAWYVERAGEQVARRYSDAVVYTLGKLRENPGLGSRCEFKHPKLQALRFCQIAQPFQKHIIFYTVTTTRVYLRNGLCTVAATCRAD